MIELKVTPVEFDSILAALRSYQILLELHSAICDDVKDIATEHSGEEMTPEEIDELCERLNCE